MMEGEARRLLRWLLLEWAMLATAVALPYLGVASGPARPIAMTGLFTKALGMLLIPTLLGAMGMLVLILPGLAALVFLIALGRVAPRLLEGTPRAMRDAALMVTLHVAALVLFLASLGLYRGALAGLGSALCLAVAWKAARAA